MRRISDGVKTTDRYKTTEQVERAFVEDQDYTFLYADDDGYTFMNQENFEQVAVSKDVLGDQAQWLQENMICILSMFNGVAVAIQLPPRVTLEITETEPAMKGQTASSSTSRPSSATAPASWCRRISSRVRASWCRRKTAPMSSARRIEWIEAPAFSRMREKEPCEA